MIAPTAPPKTPASSSTSDTTLPPRQWTYAEVALVKRVTKQTVYEWVKRGMIPSPVYTGFTARFTEEQVAEILTGVKQPGSYTVTPSPRSEVGKLGGSSIAPAKGKARNPAQQRRDEWVKKNKPKAKKGKPKHSTSTAKHTKSKGRK